MPNPKRRKTARLLMAAISDMAEASKNGVSLDHLKYFISTEYSVPIEDLSSTLKRCLNAAVQFGAIKHKKGKYIMGDVMKIKFKKKAKKPRKEKNEPEETINEQVFERYRMEVAEEPSTSTIQNKPQCQMI